jgi:hypothetical protein
MFATLPIAGTCSILRADQMAPPLFRQITKLLVDDLTCGREYLNPANG